MYQFFLYKPKLRKLIKLRATYKVKFMGEFYFGSYSSCKVQYRLQR